MTEKKFDYNYKNDVFLQLEKEFLALRKRLNNKIVKSCVTVKHAKEFYTEVGFICKFVKSMFLESDFWCSYYARMTIKLLDRFIKKINTSSIKVNELFIDTVLLRKDMLRLSSRYFLDDMLEYYDMHRSSPVFVSRRKAIEAPLFYVNRSLLRSVGIIFPDKIAPRTVVYSVAPSCGKSLIQNFGSALILAIHKLIANTGSILRISNEENNVNRFSSATMDIMRNPCFTEIYPEFAKYRTENNKFKFFQKESVEEWKVADTEVEASYYARTRDGTINSIRVKTAIMLDDPSRGLKESQDVEVHKRIITLYWSDLDDRADNQEQCSFIIGGTQFAPFDIFNDIADTYADELKEDNSIYNNSYTSIKATKNHRVVVIKVDIEDEKRQSIVPKVHNTNNLRLKEKKLNELQKGLYDLVYRQKVTALEGMGFHYSKLKTYSRLPIDDNMQSLLSKSAVAVIDPTRKGKDSFSMPIYKFCGKDGLYYLVDAIYIKQPVTELYDDIVSSFVKNNVVRVVVENNTDTSLGSFLRSKCEARGHIIDIEEIYQTKNKSERINTNQGHIRRMICFPEKDLYPRNTHMGRFMEKTTEYSFEKPTKEDDAVDTLALSVEKLFLQTDTLDNFIVTSKRLPI